MRTLWLRLMREQFMEPLLSLLSRTGHPRELWPLVVVKTCPPNKWGEHKQEEMSLLNEGLRAIALEYSMFMDVQLLDLAVILTEKQSWCFDGHHYPPGVELQHASLLLNMLLGWRGNRACRIKRP